MAAPIEVVAQCPLFVGLEREPPGHIETNLYAIDRIKWNEPKFIEYQNLVGRAEAEMGVCNRGEAAIASTMLTDVSSVIQGLMDYRNHDQGVNDKWMEAYLKILRERISVTATRAT